MRDKIAGSGKPKLFVSVSGRDKAELLRNVEIAECYDVLEWRADQFAEIESADIKSLIRKIKKPLLFTYRTRSEGGGGGVDLEGYIALNKSAADTGEIELIDLEYFTLGEAMREVTAYANKRGVKVIASSHDFEKTPPKEDIINRFRQLQNVGDIAKIAVMPRVERDVLTLINACLEFRKNYAEKPYIAISMSERGIITRFAAEHIGSAAVYAAAVEALAPGQINAREMRKILELAHKSI
ncbi:MAG: type I 3-dehydroquinate dehydratase [Deferribacteraceae bacterium]|jgi:3-dehydroquinate dehydratase-1|nr:type I 3-dehydroquinate dehydratase [Deferribacteraceae bacterium]